MVNLERFAGSAPDRLALFYYLASNPRAVEILVTLFAGSQFLTEILLRNPEYFSRLTEHKHLAQPQKRGSVLRGSASRRHSAGTKSPVNSTPSGVSSACELLRIGACDLLDLFDLPAVTAAALQPGRQPACKSASPSPPSSRTRPDGFAVIAMGKLGGQELNYSSDIDLLFLAESDAFAYRRLGERLIEALARVTAEGFLYRVDMRLRPWGQVGALVSSLDGYLAYLDQHARLWEKQALLKARAIAGDRRRWGTNSCDGPSALLFDSQRRNRARRSARDEAAHREPTCASRDATGARSSWAKARSATSNLSPNICNWRTARSSPSIRSRNTLDALARLSAARVDLAADEYRVLADGYIFLRTIEHHLQMMHYRQTDTLPNEPEALAHLARRLGFRGEAAGDQFLARYQQHGAAIRAVYLRHVGSEPMPTAADSPSLPLPPTLGEHLARMDPSYSTTFSEQDIRRHAALAEQLDADHLVEVDAAPLDDGRWRVTIVGYDYPGRAVPDLRAAVRLRL